MVERCLGAEVDWLNVVGENAANVRDSPDCDGDPAFSEYGVEDMESSQGMSAARVSDCKRSGILLVDDYQKRPCASCVI
jgi:hypothetical protein